VPAVLVEVIVALKVPDPDVVPLVGLMVWPPSLEIVTVSPETGLPPLVTVAVAVEVEEPSAVTCEGLRTTETVACAERAGAEGAATAPATHKPSTSSQTRRRALPIRFIALAHPGLRSRANPARPRASRTHRERTLGHAHPLVMSSHYSSFVADRVAKDE
jgi:hypothetical protein